MSAHYPVSGHDRAIYDAGCSSGVTIGTRALHRHHDLAPHLGVKPVGELGQPLVVSIEPKLATCSWQILPFSRRFSTKLIASP